MLHNSTTNSRGVGILIDKSLQHVIQNEHRDANNNVLAVKLVINDTSILLISIYGPNNNNYAFYDFLRHVLGQHRGTPVICAGDWNATYSTEPGTNNIDILNMLNAPSITRSTWLSDICDEYSLSDPFRAIHYDKKDFTYIPRDGGRNRSRLDFFLISDFLLGICNSCNISPSLNISLFDHKSVTLSFLSKKRLSNHFINPSIFNHPRFSAVVATSAAETYLLHARAEQADVDVAEGLLHIGRLIEKIIQCNELEFNMNFEPDPERYKQELDLCSSELDLLVNTLPDPERLNEIELTCTPDTFLEILMGNIRNSLISFQVWQQKVKTARANNIITSLNQLKINYFDNQETIFRLESDLLQLKEIEIACKMREMKIFEHLHDEKASPLFLTLTRCSKKDDLRCIRDDNGANFPSEKERVSHIVNFFAKIYKKKPKINMWTIQTVLKNF
jgi:exonuclease III